MRKTLAKFEHVKKLFSFIPGILPAKEKTKNPKR